MNEKNTPEANRLYAFGPFRLDVAERRLIGDGGVIPLTRKVFELLLILVEAAGHLKSREELIEALWPKTIVEEHSLTSKMSALRKTLGDDEETPRYIETLRGQGYRFIAPVTIQEKRLEQARDASRKRWIAAGIAGASLVLIVAGVLIWRLILTSPARSIARVSAPSIAVLPFENLSEDKANAYFASGIQDTILTKLAGIGDLRVISRTSSEQYPSRPENLKKVANQLGVATVLEGSVQKAGDRVLVNVQLINARTDDHLWAQTYTRTLKDVFAVENDVATQVAAALKAKLLPAEAVRLARPSTTSPQAYLLFLKANYLANQVSGISNAKNPVATANRAIALYHQAIARDPDFALSYARLSLIESYAYWYYYDRLPLGIDAAERAAQRALALDPALPQAHLAIGYVEYYGHRDYAAALSQFKQAAQGLPNNADVIGAIAYIHRRQGKWQEALAEIRRASVLDPRNARWPDEIGITLMMLRRYAQAEHQFDRASAIDPHGYYGSVRKVWALLLAGKPQRARQALASIPRGIDPQGLISAIRFEVAWLSRDPDQALAALADAPAWVPGPDVMGEVPRSLLQAEAWTLKRDDAQAHQAYEKARIMLQVKLHKLPDNPNLWSLLGMAEAGLGQKSKAISDGRRATELVPVSKDAGAGPFYLIALAKIYARTNETEQGVKLLGRLLSMPAGRVISIALLKRDPTWDSLRKDRGFQTLLKKGATKAVIPATSAPSAGSISAE